MPIDRRRDRERLVPIKKLAGLLPAGHGGKPTCRLETILRWHYLGLRCDEVAGGRLRLEAVKVGGRLYSTEEALWEFLERTSVQV